MQNFFDWRREDIEHYCEALAVSPVHARDLFRRAYKSLSAEPWEGEPFPRVLSSSLAREATAAGPRIVSEHLSRYDGSVKFLLALTDGATIETVLMPEKQRITLCVSSQVGCRQACVFCHTGRMGLKRQLSPGEIVGQVIVANRWLAAHPDWLEAARLSTALRVTNIVFMGMGEPLDNVESVVSAIKVMIDPYGLALGLRRISVSTAGHLEGLDRLVAALPEVRIALSVHTADEGKRSRIMPINRRWPLAAVVGRLRELFGPSRHPVMFQYTMIRGVNDQLADAEALASLTAGLNAKINLIPLNEVEPSRLSAPEPQTIQEFRDLLHQRGIRVMVRYSKGQDIAAACGQLVV